jgi:hypothetical protein
MVEVSQRRVTINSQGELGGMSPALKRHLKLQIKIAQNAARDPDKLERLLKVKQRQKQEAMDIENTPQVRHREIELLKVVLYLVATKSRN